MNAAQPRCGRISYTNGLPVYAAFDEGVLTFPGTLVSDVPSVLNRALLEGELDISPVSSALFAEHADDLLLLPDVCLSARGRVHSIFCISALEPRTLAGKPIAVTRESLTARLLLQLICRTWYGFDPKLVESDDPLAAYLADGSPCLLIGDAAVDAAESVPQANVYDLSEIWRSLTDSKMVFAVWAVRRAYARQAAAATAVVAQALATSLAWAYENMGQIVRRAQLMHPHREGFYADYYHSLDFHFDEPARAALSLFFEKGKAAGVFSAAPALQFFEPAPQHV